MENENNRVDLLQFCLFWQYFEAIWEYYIVCIVCGTYKCVGRRRVNSSTINNRKI